MTDSTLSAQDERRALAKQLLTKVFELGIEQGRAECSYTPPSSMRRFNKKRREYLDELLAALRADPARGAEEMRERIGSLSDGEHTLRLILQAWCEPDYPTAEEQKAASSYADAWLDRIALAIRALPAAQGGGE